MAVSKPTVGQPGWGPLLNAALDDVDVTNASSAAKASVDAAVTASETRASSTYAGLTRLHLNARNRTDPLKNAVGDGASHPLSERFGSLAAAQAVFPHATALTDEIDWAALQSAFNDSDVVGSTVGGIQPAGGAFTAYAAQVFVPHGHYKVNKGLTGGAYLKIHCPGRAIIECTSATVDIVTVTALYSVEITGVSFVGGKRHLAVTNANVDSATLAVSRCEFQHASAPSVEFYLAGATTNLSLLASFRDCKFLRNSQVMKICAGVEVAVDDTWVTATSDAGVGQMLQAGAVFENRGQLAMRRMHGVPNTFTAAQGNDETAPTNWPRWIDNYSHVSALSCRFGGEGAGMPIVMQYGGPQQVYPYNNGSTISLIDCAMAIGNTASASALVYFATNIPQRATVIGGNAITGDGSDLFRAVPTFDVAAYLGGIDPNVTFTWTVQGNMIFPVMEKYDPSTGKANTQIPAALVNDSRFNLNTTVAGAALDVTIGSARVQNHIRGTTVMAAPSASLADGAIFAEIVSTPGAAYGDIAHATHDAIQGDVLISAYVDGPNRVRVTFQNKTGVAYAIPAGTIVATVWKYA